MRRLKGPKSGYDDPDGNGFIERLDDFLVAVVRHQYAQGDFDIDTLERRIEAALRGDHEACGLLFLPMQMTYIWR